MNAVPQNFVSDSTLRRARHAPLALVLLGALACAEPADTFVPPMPGSIAVATETSGFLKDDGYELLLNGEGRGRIGADAAVTLSDLQPGTYEIALGDVNDNCAVDGASVTVVSEETASVSLAVVCSFGDATAYTIRFNRARPNLDNGEITECPFGLCPTEEQWDLYVFYDSQSDPGSVIRQNLTTAVQIAHVTGVALADLTEANFDTASFTTELVGEAFDSGRVILLRTDLGFVYALGNPVENETAQTLSFDVILIAEP